MITNINKILIEWAYRTRDGKPNPKSMAHQIILEGILREYGWNIEQRGELLRNLQEAPTKSAEDEKYFSVGFNSYILKKDKPKDWKKGDTLPSGIQKFSKDEKSGKYSPVGEKPEDDKDVKKDDKPGDITKEPDAFDRFADEPSVQDKEKADATAAKKAALAKKKGKLIALKQQPKSKILRDKNGRILTIDGKDKKLTKGPADGSAKTTGHSENHTEELVDPTDEDFKEKPPAKNKMGHPNEPVPNPEADLDNDPAMIAILEALGSPPYKFPKKYLKLLSRLLNTHGGGSAVKALKNYIDGGGAGQINSQAGELLAVIGSALPPKEREEFFNLIEKHLDSQMDPDAEPPTAPTKDEWDKVVNAEDPEGELAALQAKYPHLKIDTTAIRERMKRKPPEGPTLSQKNWKKNNNLVVNHGWLHAARQNCKAIDKYIKKNYPPPCKVEASAWDTKEDFEALGNDNYKKNKGGSSDQYLKVECPPDESHLVEVSLKKDGTIRLSNSSPSQLFDYPNLTEDEKTEFSDEASADDNMLPVNCEDSERLYGDPLKAAQKANPTLKLFPGCCPPGDVSIEDASEAKFHQRQNKRFIKAMEGKADKLCEKLKSGELTPDRKLGKLVSGNPRVCDMDRIKRLLKGEFDGRKRNRLFMEFLTSEAKDGDKDAKKVLDQNDADSKQTQKNIVHAMKHEPLKSKMIEGIREKLPLKSLFEGEEMMALDDVSYDKDTMQECFGVDSWDELKEHLRVDDTTDPEHPVLYYEITVDGKKIKFKIAEIVIRQDGKEPHGYGNIRLDLKLEPEFEQAMRECDEKVHGKSE